MDLLTFTSKFIEAIVWPAATILLVLILRKEISTLAPLIKRLKAGPLEAEFEREVKALRALELDELHGNTATSQGVSSKSLLYQLAELHPRSAILEAWIQLEAAARSILGAHSAVVSQNAYLPAARLMEPLAQKQLVDQRQVTLFHELRRLRNEVAHLQGLAPTAESARAYVDLAAQLQTRLEGQSK